MIIKEPFNQCVYQRNNDNKAAIPIKGTIAVGTDTVTATFAPIVGDNLKAIVQTLPVDSAGNFGGVVIVPGGLYKLSLSGGKEYGTVNEVGGGEVIGLFGHSYMQGGHDATHNLPAQDRRVFTLMDSETERKYVFGRLVDTVGPFTSVSYAWGQLGDKLTARLGVPVMFYAMAYGGSNIAMNYRVIKNIPRNADQLPPGQHDVTTRQPFEPVENVFSNYVPYTGIRCLLVQHGYNDRSNEDAPVFLDHFKAVIDYIRSNWNKPNLSIVLAQEQLTNVTNSLYNAVTGPMLATLISTYPNTYKGVDFNTPYWVDVFPRTNHDHLYGEMIDKYASDWADAMNTAFFTSSTPYLSTEAVNIEQTVTANSAVPKLAVIDWVVLLGVSVCLFAVVIYKSKNLVYLLVALVLFSLGRFSAMTK